MTTCEDIDGGKGVPCGTRTSASDFNINQSRFIILLLDLGKPLMRTIRVTIATCMSLYTKVYVIKHMVDVLYFIL